MLLLLLAAGCVTSPTQPPAGEEVTLAPQVKVMVEDVLGKLAALSNNGQKVDVSIESWQPLGEHLINLSVRVEGQPQPLNVYITADGKYIVLGNVADIASLKKEVEAQLKVLEEGTPVNYDIALKGPVKGNPEAPVAIVEFSDFQCPYCYRFWQQTLPALQENYIDPGKIAYYYRDFPLSFHPAAMPSAIAAYCAGKQGKFWEYHDKLFENHDKLATADDAFYTSLAEEIGLDVAAFEECRNSTEASQYVQESFAEGQQYGVQGTPSFFIVVSKEIPREKVVQASRYIPGAKVLVAPNSYIIAFSGAMPYEVLDRALSTLLSE